MKQLNYRDKIIILKMQQKTLGWYVIVLETLINVKDYLFTFFVNIGFTTQFKVHTTHSCVFGSLMSSLLFEQCHELFFPHGHHLFFSLSVKFNCNISD